MIPKQAPERVLAEFHKRGMRGYKYLGQWNGYDVWIFSPADRFDVQYFGGVFCVLDDGEHARGSSRKEGYEILDFFYPKP